MVATFLHDTSRNLDPQLHTHAVLANMVRGEDGKWRTMANEGLYRNQKLIGMIYRSELARGLMKLGYEIEKTHADGRFEIAGVSRRVIEAFSTRRAEIEAAVAERSADGSGTAANQRLAERAALMTRASKRDVDKEALREHWREQASTLGLVFSASNSASRESGEAIRKSEADVSMPASESKNLATEAVKWAVAHLSEREAVFSRSDLLAAALSWKPGMVSVEAAERAVDGLRKENGLYVAPAFHTGDGLTTDRALADERETIGLMREGQDRGRPVMRSWSVTARLHKGPADRGPEGSREADPVRPGPGGGGAGICRHGQDHDAEPGEGAGGEAGIPHGRTRPLGLGGGYFKFRGGHPGRDPADVPWHATPESPRGG